MNAQERIERFEGICARIAAAAVRAGRFAADVRLVAVSKWHGADAVAGLAAHWARRRAGAGLPLFGESYVQEALSKRTEVAALNPDVPVEWHFIGHLQTNKAKEVAGNFTLVHSVGSERLGAALHKAWEAQAAPIAQIAQVTQVPMPPRVPGQETLPPQAILVQVNIGREAQKSGVLPEEAEALALALAALPGLSVQGLMCLPPDLDDPEAVRPFFRELRVLRDTIHARTGLALPHLSMGMSHDFEQAVEEGATLVRVGTDIFGPRA